MVTLREINDRDWPSVDRLQRMAYSAELLEGIDALQSIGQRSPKTCLLAEDSEPLGYLIAHPWMAEDLPPLNVVLPEIPTGAQTWFLHDLALSPAARGRGIARELVETGFAAGRALGLRDAALLSVQGSEFFWQKFGFRTRPDLTEKVAPILHAFAKVPFVFMTRDDLLVGKD